MKKRILVIGGTGLLGRPVVRHLQAAGFFVQVMARHPEKATELAAADVELIPGDVADQNSLRQAMRNCQGVHISVSGEADRLSAEQVATLAPELGIEHITYISGATVRADRAWFPMIEAKLRAEEAIRASGLPWTVFCPTWPMEMLPRFAREGKPFMMGRQPKPLHFFAADELGRMVTRAYQTEAACNKRLYIHGPEGMPFREALDRYCARFYPEGKSVSVMPLWLAKLLGKLTGNKNLQFGAALMAYFDKVGEDGDPTEANALLGAPQITLDQWMTQREGAYTK